MVDSIDLFDREFIKGLQQRFLSLEIGRDYLNRHFEQKFHFFNKNEKYPI